MPNDTSISMTAGSPDCLVCLNETPESASGQHQILKAMFAHSSFSFAIFDSDGRFIRVNDSFARLFNLHPDQFTGRRLPEILPATEPHSGQLQSLLDEALRSGNPRRLSGLPHAKRDDNGETAYLNWNLEPVRGENGAPALVVLSAIDVSDLRHTEEELRRSESLYQTVVNVMGEGIVCQSADGKITAINPAAARILGRRPEDMLGLNSSSPVWRTLREDGSPFPSEAHPPIAALRTGQPANSIIMGIYRPDDELVWISINSQPVPGVREGDAIAVVSTFHDITAMKAVEATHARLNRSLRLLSQCNQILIHAQDEQKLLKDICRLIVERGDYLMAWVGYAEHDADKTVRPVAEFGYGEDYLRDINISWGDNESGEGPTGTSIRTATTSVNQDYLTNPLMRPWYEAAMRRGYQSSISLPLKEGSTAFGALAIYSAEPYSFAPEEVTLLEEMADDLAFGICTLRAHARRKIAEEQLAFLAHHDPLTRLPNRVLLRERFEEALKADVRTPVAMLFLDLDGFKEINDSLGHTLGDELLVKIVDRLSACLDGHYTLSREGGDEFLVLLPGITNREQIGRIAQKLLDAARESFVVGNNTLHTSFSIGISTYPQDGLDFDTLRKSADIAMYRAKESGRNNFRFFTEQMNTDAMSRLSIQNDLHGALRAQEFRLHFQPQVDIADSRIVGMEALIRWQRASGELVPPNRFIPVAEQSGLIIPIGAWVLEQACLQAMEWQRQGLPEMVMAVNLSAVQFRHGNIVETVSRVLSASGLPPHLLELELTESILLLDTDASIKTLHTLKEIGVKLSIDDFGTGYSSLSYLKRLAVDKLKIDQTFVHDMTEDADNQEIVRAIIQLGHILKLEIIAEGVETEAQRDCLRIFGCDQIQGYLISKPLPPEQIPALVK